MTYKVIDVSYWQGAINWKQVYADGVRGAIIRFADGMMADSRFTSNMQNAKAAGLHVGAYIFSRALNLKQAREEAKRIIKACKPYKCDLPLYIDLEWSEQAQIANALATAYLDECDKQGVKGGIYANLNWFKNYINAKKFAKYPLWIAQYNDKMTHENPDLFGMWQYSSKGRVKGISGNVDMNKLYIAYWDQDKPKETKKKAAKKSVTTIAKEVIVGKWGNGEERKKKLEKAGYDYKAVQKKVNELMKK